MIEVECPCCHKKITHLNVEHDGKYGWGFCPKCNFELSEVQVKELNAEYDRQHNGGTE